MLLIHVNVPSGVICGVANDESENLVQTVKKKTAFCFVYKLQNPWPVVAYRRFVYTTENTGAYLPTYQKFAEFRAPLPNLLTSRGKNDTSTSSCCMLWRYKNQSSPDFYAPPTLYYAKKCIITEIKFNSITRVCCLPAYCRQAATHNALTCGNDFIKAKALDGS